MLMYSTKKFENRELGFELTQVINSEQTNSNELWFVGKRVAEMLGYSNTKDAISRLVDDCDKQVVRLG